MRLKPSASRLIPSLSLGILIACSGGKGISPESTTHQIPPSETSLAKSSNIKAVYDVDADQILISWDETLKDVRSYRIEQSSTKAGGETWTGIDTLSNADNAKAKKEWKGKALSGKYRVIAIKDAYSLPLSGSELSNNLEILVPEKKPEIALAADSENKVIGKVDLSLLNSAQYSTVEYFLDSKSLGMSSAGPDFKCHWDTNEAPNGPAMLRALAKCYNGVIHAINKQITIENSYINIQSKLVMDTKTPFCEATAEANLGVEKLELFRDQVSLGALTAPDANGKFKWSLADANPATYKLVATDKKKNTKAQFMYQDDPEPLVKEIPTSCFYIKDQEEASYSCLTLCQGGGISMLSISDKISLPEGAIKIRASACTTHNPPSTSNKKALKIIEV